MSVIGFGDVSRRTGRDRDDRGGVRTTVHPYTEALLSAIPGRADADDRIILEGDVPDPSNVPSGCRFHPRCPHKIGDVCEEEVPEVHEPTDGHGIKCHLLREEYRDRVDWDDI